MSTKLDQLKIDRPPEKERPAMAWVLWLVGLLLLLAVAFWYFFKPDPVLEVQTQTSRLLRAETVGTVLNASGYVTARRQATVSSKFTGRVTEVLIEEGMNVEEGQILARLDDSNISASFELALAQKVSAESGLMETTALLNEATANLRRTRELVERKLASPAELDRVKAQAESLEAQLNRRKADVKVAERQVDVYRQQVEDTIIRAPFAGVVVAKNAQPGEMISPVSAGGGFTRTGIGTVVDMTSLEIEIDVNEAYINRVEAGQPVVATLDAYPDWNIPCHVIAIIPTADRQRATVEVRVGFDQTDARILPDMGVKVAFQESAADQSGGRSGVLVPPTAVQQLKGKDYVFIVSQGVVEQRAVTVAGTRGTDLLISAGLIGGERLVTGNPPGLVDGARVRTQ